MIAAAAAAPVTPVLGQQILNPSSRDMAQVAAALVRLPDATAVQRAASQTLPSSVGDNAIRGTMASVNRVIATRTDAGNVTDGMGSGFSSGEAKRDRQVWLMPFESRSNQGDRDGEPGFSATTWGMATGAEMELERGRIGLSYAYTRLQSPSYAESGAGDLNLLVQGKRSQALLLGTAARLNYALTPASQISTYLGASYDVINDRDDLVATYAGAPGQSFTTPGPARSPWLLKAGVSYRFKLVEAADILLRFDAEGRSGFINQSAAIKASWRF